MFKFILPEMNAFKQVFRNIREVVKEEEHSTIHSTRVHFFSCLHFLNRDPSGLDRKHSMIFLAQDHTKSCYWDQERIH